MIVMSKFAVTEVEAPRRYLGLFDSVPYNCHEVGHTWNPSCTATSRDVFIKAFRFSLKIYIPLYILGAMMQLRRKNVNRREIVRKTLHGILQSSVFLAMNGALFMASFCVYGIIFGKYHNIFGYVTGFVSSFLSILIERKSRRGALSIYVFNLALETVFKMLVSRGFIRPVRHGEVFLFALANTLYLGLFRSGNLPPSVHNIFGKVLGLEETRQMGGQKGPYQSRTACINFLLVQYRRFITFLNNLGPNVRCCPHSGSCSAYAAQGAFKYFSIGYGLQVVMQYRSIITAVTKGNLLLLRSSLLKFTLPKFVFAYVTLFRVTNCVLRWMFGCDSPGLYGSLSGFAAGLSSFLYPSTSIVMYALSKMIEILVMKAVARNWLPYIHHFDTILYSVSMAIMFHAAMFEPQNIRPGYWKFMIELSGRCFPLVFRILLDKFGTESSKLYPGYVPDLDLSLVKTDEVKRVLAYFGRWP